MKNFALLDDQNKVIDISIADDEWAGKNWLSYDETNPAFIGGDYYEGFFYPIQPYPSWTRDGKGHWIPPIPYPDDGLIYVWDENDQDWAAYVEQSEA